MLYQQHQLQYLKAQQVESKSKVSNLHNRGNAKDLIHVCIVVLQHSKMQLALQRKTGCKYMPI